MEQACDEAALCGQPAGTRRAYGEALLRVAEWQPLRAGLALGMLPFGGGLGPRLRALRFTRRWPMAAQLALVAAVVAATVLASGTRVGAAPTSPQLPPDITAFHVQVYSGTAPVPDAAVRAHVPLTLQAGEETSVTFAQRVDAEAARAALEAGTTLMGESTSRFWEGFPLATNMRFKGETTEGALAQEVRMTFRVSLTIEERELHATVGLLGPGVTEGRTVLAPGEGLLLPGPTFQGAPLRALITPANVTWTDGVAAFDQLRASYDLRDKSVQEAMEMFQALHAVPVPFEGETSRRVDLQLKDATPADFLRGLAESAGLLMELNEQRTGWRLRSPEAPATEVERLKEVLDAAGVDVEAVSIQLDHRDGVLHAQIAGGARPGLPGVVEALRAAGFEPGEPASTSAAGGDLVSLRIPPRTIVTIAAQIWRLDEKALDEIMPPVVNRQLPFSARLSSLSAEPLQAIRTGLERLAAESRAEALTRPVLRVQLGETASISTELGATGESVSITVAPRRGEGGVVVADYEATWTGAGGGGIETTDEPATLPVVEVVREPGKLPVLVLIDVTGRR